MGNSCFESLTKFQLMKLCDEVKSGNREALDRAICFFVVETQGLWHGRARAKLTRRLKHIALPDAQVRRIVDVVVQRFVAGRFSEQFKDQLRLCLHLAPEHVLVAARGCHNTKLPHVKRYSDWLLAHDHLRQRTEPVARANAR